MHGPSHIEAPLPQNFGDDLSRVLEKIAAVRRRLRLQNAVRGFCMGLFLASLLFLLLLLAHRLGFVPKLWLGRSLCALAAGAVACSGWFAFRSIDPLQVATLVDQTHGLHNRLASALQFAADFAPKNELATGLALLAIRDAGKAAARVQQAIAAPWQKPKILPFLCGLLVLNGLAWFLKLDFRKPRPMAPPPAPVVPQPELHIDPELLAPEKEELLQKIADAAARGDTQTAERLRELLRILQKVEQGELSRQQAFVQLAEIEGQLRQTDPTLDEMEKRLRQAGQQLAESQLAAPLGQALAKQDVERAKQELQKLANQDQAQTGAEKRQQMADAFERAAQALAGQPHTPHDSQANADSKTGSKNDTDAKTKDEWQPRGLAEDLVQKKNAVLQKLAELQKKLEKRPGDESLLKQRDELLREQKEIENALKQELARQQQETEKQRQAASEKQRELEQQKTELQQEERRLKKKLSENPQDEETERRLKKTQRQLQQLEQTLQDQTRQLQRLENPSAGYQNELQKLTSEMERERQQFEDELRKLRQQKKRLEEQLRSLSDKLKANPRDEKARKELEDKRKELSEVEKKLRDQQEAQKQMQKLQQDLEQAAERMRKSLEKMTPEERRALEELSRDLSSYEDEVRKLKQRKREQGQTVVTIDQIKQVLRRLGQSGSGSGGQKKDWQDFKKRAGGGQGDGQTLVLGGGPDGQSTIVVMPGQSGQSGQSGQKPGGQSGQNPADNRPGTGHDPNFLGDVTQIESKRKLTRVYGKEGTGPTRSQTIQGAAEKGFATTSYRKVYGDYAAVSEEVMSKHRVPSGYRFYVKRYFQMIKPRGTP